VSFIVKYCRFNEILFSEAESTIVESDFVAHDRANLVPKPKLNRNQLSFEQTQKQWENRTLQPTSKTIYFSKISSPKSAKLKETTKSLGISICIISYEFIRVFIAFYGEFAFLEYLIWIIVDV
jgi:hypothetical protein